MSTDGGLLNWCCEEFGMSTGVSRCIGMVLAVLTGSMLAATAMGQANDRVLLATESVFGRVIAISPDTIELEDKAGDVRRFAVADIRDVQFANEPPSLREARGLLLRGRHAEAQSELERIEPIELEGVSRFVLADYDYVRAAAAAHLSGPDTAAKAGHLVEAFLNDHQKSYHVFELRELLGDLRLAAGDITGAIEEYERVAAGAVSYRVRAAAAKGRALVSAGRFEDAVAAYDAALAMPAGDASSLAQQREAEVGRAAALLRLDRAADAAAAMRSVLDRADPEEARLLARASCVLGDAYRTMGGRDQDAILAYLTVDLLYNTVPESHAEALFHLIALWERARQPARAREARGRLESSYPASPWADRVRQSARGG